MKRIFAKMTALTLAVVLAACGATPSDSAESREEQKGKTQRYREARTGKCRENRKARTGRLRMSRKVSSGRNQKMRII